MEVEKKNGEKAQFLGFAYKKNDKESKLVYGKKPEEILSTLHRWNGRLPEAERYTIVNIGELDKNSDKYINYRRFQVESGKDITPIYLQLPSVKMEEFAKLTGKINDMGAKYNGILKKWYIRPGMEDDFREYLPNKDKKIEKAAEKEDTPQLPSAEKKDKYTFWEKVISSVDVGEKGDAQLQKEILEDYFKVEKLQNSIADKLQSIIIMEIRRDGEVSQNSKLIAELQGYQINEDGWIEKTIYREEPQEKGFETEERIQEREEKSVNEPDIKNPFEEVPKYNIGEKMKCYAQKEYFTEAGQMYVADVKWIEGIVKDIDCQTIPNERIYQVEHQGFVFYVEEGSLYSSSQSNSLLRARGDKLLPEQYHMLARHEFTAGQMEEIRFGFKEGLSKEQIAAYAKPEIKSQHMEIYKYGMQYGIKAEQIELLLNKNLDADWVEHRNGVSELIKEKRNIIAENISAAGFRPDFTIVKIMEKVNHLTGKENTIKDICDAYKNKLFQDRMPEAQESIDKLGKEFQRQELYKTQAIEILP